VRLLNWPTEMTKIRSIFQLNLAIWKQGNFFFFNKEDLFWTSLINMATLHWLWLLEMAS
jgi:hypothetical protein